MGCGVWEGGDYRMTMRISRPAVPTVPAKAAGLLAAQQLHSG